MEFGDSNIDTSGLDDRRSGGGGFPGGGVGMGVGGLGGLGIVALVIFLLLGGDPAQLTQGTDAVTSGTSSTQQSAGDVAQRCSTAQAQMSQDDCFVLKTFNETNKTWAVVGPTAGINYSNPKLVYYRGGTTTGGCGSASASVGPFYCPGDQGVYIDLDFLNQLQEQFGMPGRYAQAYIVAHEVGHHVQNLAGIDAQVRQFQQKAPAQANALSVKMELQADCFAGVWASAANKSGSVTASPQDYAQALNAAAAVGDDKIMAGSGMKVNEEKFTHGSAAQRQAWFQRGYQTGDPAQCNTFAA